MIGARIISEAKPLLVAASEKSGARWCTYGAGDIAVSKLNAVVCNRINVRSWEVATLIPNITVAKIISEKNNDIRCRSRCFTNKAAQEKSYGENAVLVHGVFERKKRGGVLREEECSGSRVQKKKFFKDRLVSGLKDII